jgi:rhodanese-related sulfurtransferase
MSVKEVLWQTAALVVFCCGAAWVELYFLEDPPDIVFLRADDLYADGASAVSDGGEPSTTAGLISVGDYFSKNKFTVLNEELALYMSPENTAKLDDKLKECVGNECDMPDTNLVIFISETTAFELYERGESQFVDARTEDDFVAGHVPFAVSMPITAFGAGWPDEMELLMKELVTVIYCEGMSCDSSQLVAKHLIRYGIKNIRIIETGFPGWRKQGYEEEKGASNV